MAVVPGQNPGFARRGVAPHPLATRFAHRLWLALIKGRGGIALSASFAFGSDLLSAHSTPQWRNWQTPGT